MKNKFDIFDTVEIFYPDNWTNSKLLLKSFREIPTKGFFISCDYGNLENNRFGSVFISFNNDDKSHYLGSGIIICTSRMVLVEKFNKKMNMALITGLYKSQITRRVR